MTTLLQIKASISHDQGLSSQLANKFVAAYRRAIPTPRFWCAKWPRQSPCRI